MKLFNELRQPWARFIQWIVRHYKLVLVISGIVIVGSAAAVVHTITTQKPTSAIDKPIVKVVEKPKPVVPTKYYSPLTGKLVANETATKQPVTGVMIENSPDARPQSGLKDSGVVFEAIAEGGITRFLVLYQAEKTPTDWPGSQPTII